MMKKGFTLLELIVVIIILGILATLGFTQYTKMVEKGRTAEAKMILGQIRTAQNAYYLENDIYTTTLDDLPVSAPALCTSTHYFRYSTSGGSTFMARAFRCTVDGKLPQGTSAYSVRLNSDGEWDGTPGYF